MLACRLKRTRGDWRLPGHFHHGLNNGLRRLHHGATAMTTKQYLAALKRLGLTPASKRTAAALGLTVRQCQRLAAGGNVSDSVALLLAMYLRHGLPSEL
jgi:hypothetical protein